MNTTNANMKEMRVPVLIVGGGGCGLSTSIFLSNLGVDSLLVERHDKPSPMPKARYLNQRTMEIFRQHGIAEAVYERSFPIDNMAKMRWCTSLGGDGPMDRKKLFEMDSFGGGSLKERYSADSPCPSTLYPQVRLEPLLRAQAQDRNVGELRFNTELISLSQTSSEVEALIRDRASGAVTLVRAQYVVAADAGKTVGPIVGARLEGTPELTDMVTVYFKADLSQYIDDDTVMTFWFANPEGDPSSWGTGVLGKLGPKHFDRHSEEWIFHFSFPPGENVKPGAETLVPRLRALLKIPDLEPEILGIGNWIVQGVLANRYRFGRVFLAGDAAHRHTPTTGLGLNSAVHDAHNIAWKLAMVIGGHAEDALLDAYEDERRPVAARNVEWALFTFANHLITGPAIGIVPGDARRTRESFAALLADTEDGRSRRHRFHEAMQIHKTEFQAHDLEIGFHYGVGALVPDGTPAPVRDPAGYNFVPTTRPGHRLPHAWLTHGNTKLSTLDLVKRDRFLLIVHKTDSAWCAAARLGEATTGLPLDVVAIGPGGDYLDPLGDWRGICGISQDGALLVRPDQYIAWRATGVSRDAAAELQAAFAAVLGRPSTRRKQPAPADHSLNARHSGSEASLVHQETQ